MEDDHPDLASRLRASEWVPMTLPEARATFDADPAEGHREAWIAAASAVHALEAEHERQRHLERMKDITVQGWVAQRRNEGENDPLYRAASVLGMDVVSHPVDPDAVRMRAAELGMPWGPWGARDVSPGSRS